MPAGGRILVVDDDADTRHLLGLRLARAGYQVSQAASGEAALLRFRECRPQLVITDLCMGKMDGLALFGELQACAPGVPVIMLTAHGTIPDAVAATQRGIFCFLAKPFDGQELLQRVGEAMQFSPVLSPEHAAAAWRKDLITVSVRMDEVLRQAWRVALEGSAALLVGPSGCGKAALVRAIHRASPRAAGPLLRVSCAGLEPPEQEALLLPHNLEGVLAQAAGGLLYLEEIGALSNLAQARLLSVLMAQVQAADPLCRLGQAFTPESVPDVQIVASTLRPLDAAVADGSFRRDLYYLLGRTTLLVPSLAERPEDIPVLSRHLLSEMRPESALSLAPEALAALQAMPWPGNVRQLKSVLEQAAAASLTSVLSVAAVRRVRLEHETESLAAFDDARRDFERDYLVRLLLTTAGNVTHAARIARRNRTEFYKLLARHGIDPASFK